MIGQKRSFEESNHDSSREEGESSKRRVETKKAVVYASSSQAYIVPAPIFDWDHVVFEKLKREKTYKYVPLSIKKPNGAMQRGVNVQFSNLNVPFQPKLKELPNGKKMFLVLSDPDGDELERFYTEGNKSMVENAKRNRHSYFKKEDGREDADIERCHRKMHSQRYKKYIEDENGEPEPVESEGMWPVNLECTIPINEHGESMIQVMDKTTGEMMSATDIAPGSRVDVLLRLNRQWFGGGKFSIKPIATRIVVYPREDYLQTSMLPAEHMELAKKGQDIYTANGDLVKVEKKEEDVEENKNDVSEQMHEDSVKEETNDDDFIAGFGAK